METPGRNDPCPCGSGKKYKKCCQSNKSKKKFSATQIDANQMDSLAKKTSSITSIFQPSTPIVDEPSPSEKTEEETPEQNDKA